MSYRRDYGSSNYLNDGALGYGGSLSRYTRPTPQYTSSHRSLSSGRYGGSQYGLGGAGTYGSSYGGKTYGSGGYGGSYGLGSGGYNSRSSSYVSGIDRAGAYQSSSLDRASSSRDRYTNTYAGASNDRYSSLDRNYGGYRSGYQSDASSTYGSWDRRSTRSAGSRYSSAYSLPGSRDTSLDRASLYSSDYGYSRRGDRKTVEPVEERVSVPARVKEIESIAARERRERRAARESRRYESDISATSSLHTYASDRNDRQNDSKPSSYKYTSRHRDRETASPPRRSQRETASPPRRIQRETASPPRRSQRETASPPRRSQRETASPPRRSQQSRDSETSRRSGYSRRAARRHETDTSESEAETQHDNRSTPEALRDHATDPVETIQTVQYLTTRATSPFEFDSRYVPIKNRAKTIANTKTVARPRKLFKMNVNGQILFGEKAPPEVVTCAIQTGDGEIESSNLNSDGLNELTMSSDFHQLFDKYTGDVENTSDKNRSFKNEIDPETLAVVKKSRAKKVKDESPDEHSSRRHLSTELSEEEERERSQSRKAKRVNRLKREKDLYITESETEFDEVAPPKMGRDRFIDDEYKSATEMELCVYTGTDYETEPEEVMEPPRFDEWRRNNMIGCDQIEQRIEHPRVHLMKHPETITEDSETMYGTEKQHSSPTERAETDHSSGRVQKSGDRLSSARSTDHGKPGSKVEFGPHEEHQVVPSIKLEPAEEMIPTEHQKLVKEDEDDDDDIPGYPDDQAVSVDDNEQELTRYYLQKHRCMQELKDFDRDHQWNSPNDRPSHLSLSQLEVPIESYMAPLTPEALALRESIEKVLSWQESLELPEHQMPDTEYTEEPIYSNRTRRSESRGSSRPSSRQKLNRDDRRQGSFEGILSSESDDEDSAIHTRRSKESRERGSSRDSQGHRRSSRRDQSGSSSEHRSRSTGNKRHSSKTHSKSSRPSSRDDIIDEYSVSDDYHDAQSKLSTAESKRCQSQSENIKDKKSSRSRSASAENILDERKTPSSLTRQRTQDSSNKSTRSRSRSFEGILENDVQEEHNESGRSRSRSAENILNDEIRENDLESEKPRSKSKSTEHIIDDVKESTPDRPGSRSAEHLPEQKLSNVGDDTSFTSGLAAKTETAEGVVDDNKKQKREKKLRSKSEYDSILDFGAPSISTESTRSKSRSQEDILDRVEPTVESREETEDKIIESKESKTDTQPSVESNLDRHRNVQEFLQHIDSLSQSAQLRKKDRKRSRSVGDVMVMSELSSEDKSKSCDNFIDVVRDTDKDLNKLNDDMKKVASFEDMLEDILDKLSTTGDFDDDHIPTVEDIKSVFEEKAESHEDTSKDLKDEEVTEKARGEGKIEAPKDVGKDKDGTQELKDQQTCLQTEELKPLTTEDVVSKHSENTESSEDFGMTWETWEEIVKVQAIPADQDSASDDLLEKLEELSDHRSIDDLVDEKSEIAAGKDQTEIVEASENEVVAQEVEADSAGLLKSAENKVVEEPDKSTEKKSTKTIPEESLKTEEHTEGKYQETKPDQSIKVETPSEQDEKQQDESKKDIESTKNGSKRESENDVHTDKESQQTDISVATVSKQAETVTRTEVHEERRIVTEVVTAAEDKADLEATSQQDGKVSPPVQRNVQQPDKKDLSETEQAKEIVRDRHGLAEVMNEEVPQNDSLINKPGAIEDLVSYNHVEKSEGDVSTAAITPVLSPESDDTGSDAPFGLSWDEIVAKQSGKKDSQITETKKDEIKGGYLAVSVDKEKDVNKTTEEVLSSPSQSSDDNIGLTWDQIMAKQQGDVQQVDKRKGSDIEQAKERVRDRHGLADVMNEEVPQNDSLINKPGAIEDLVSYNHVEKSEGDVSRAAIKTVPSSESDDTGSDAPFGLSWDEILAKQSGKRDSQTTETKKDEIKGANLAVSVDKEKDVKNTTEEVLSTPSQSSDDNIGLTWDQIMAKQQGDVQQIDKRKGSEIEQAKENIRDRHGLAEVMNDDVPKNDSLINKPGVIEDLISYNHVEKSDGNLAVKRTTVDTLPSPSESSDDNIGLTWDQIVAKQQKSEEKQVNITGRTNEPISTIDNTVTKRNDSEINTIAVLEPSKLETERTREDQGSDDSIGLTWEEIVKQQGTKIATALDQKTVTTTEPCSEVPEIKIQHVATKPPGVPPTMKQTPNDVASESKKQDTTFDSEETESDENVGLTWDEIMRRQGLQKAAAQDRETLMPAKIRTGFGSAPELGPLFDDLGASATEDISSDSDMTASSSDVDDQFGLTWNEILARQQQKRKSKTAEQILDELADMEAVVKPLPIIKVTKDDDENRGSAVQENDSVVDRESDVHQTQRVTEIPSPVTKTQSEGTSDEQKGLTWEQIVAIQREDEITSRAPTIDRKEDIEKSTMDETAHQQQDRSDDVLIRGNDQPMPQLSIHEESATIQDERVEVDLSNRESSENLKGKVEDLQTFTVDDHTYEVDESKVTVRDRHGLAGKLAQDKSQRDAKIHQPGAIENLLSYNHVGKPKVDRTKRVIDEQQQEHQKKETTPLATDEEKEARRLTGWRAAFSASELHVPGKKKPLEEVQEKKKSLEEVPELKKSLEEDTVFDDEPMLSDREARRLRLRRGERSSSGGRRLSSEGRSDSNEPREKQSGLRRRSRDQLSVGDEEPVSRRYRSMEEIAEKGAKDRLEKSASHLDIATKRGGWRSSLGENSRSTSLESTSSRRRSSHRSQDIPEEGELERIQDASKGESRTGGWRSVFNDEPLITNKDSSLPNKRKSASHEVLSVHKNDARVMSQSQEIIDTPPKSWREKLREEEEQRLAAQRKAKEVEQEPTENKVESRKQSREERLSKLRDEMLFGKTKDTKIEKQKIDEPKPSIKDRFLGKVAAQQERKDKMEKKPEARRIPGLQASKAVDLIVKEREERMKALRVEKELKEKELKERRHQEELKREEQRKKDEEERRQADAKRRADETARLAQLPGWRQSVYGDKPLENREDVHHQQQARQEIQEIPQSQLEHKDEKLDSERARKQQLEERIKRIQEDAQKKTQKHQPKVHPMDIATIHKQKAAGFAARSAKFQQDSDVKQSPYIKPQEPIDGELITAPETKEPERKKDKKVKQPEVQHVPSKRSVVAERIRAEQIKQQELREQMRLEDEKKQKLKEEQERKRKQGWKKDSEPLPKQSQFVREDGGMDTEAVYEQPQANNQRSDRRRMEQTPLVEERREEKRARSQMVIEQHRQQMAIEEQKRQQERKEEMAKRARKFQQQEPLPQQSAFKRNEKDILLDETIPDQQLTWTQRQERRRLMEERKRHEQQQQQKQRRNEEQQSKVQPQRRQGDHLRRYEKKTDSGIFEDASPMNQGNNALRVQRPQGMNDSQWSLYSNESGTDSMVTEDSYDKFGRRLPRTQSLDSLASSVHSTPFGVRDILPYMDNRENLMTETEDDEIMIRFNQMGRERTTSIGGSSTGSRRSQGPVFHSKVQDIDALLDMDLDWEDSDFSDSERSDWEPENRRRSLPAFPKPSASMRDRAKRLPPGTVYHTSCRDIDDLLGVAQKVKPAGNKRNQFADKSASAVNLYHLSTVDEEHHLLDSPVPNTHGPVMKPKQFLFPGDEGHSHSATNLSKMGKGNKRTPNKSQSTGNLNDLDSILNQMSASPAQHRKKNALGLIGNNNNSKVATSDSLVDLKDSSLKRGQKLQPWQVQVKQTLQRMGGIINIWDLMEICKKPKDPQPAYDEDEFDEYFEGYGTMDELLDSMGIDSSKVGDVI